MEYIGDNSKRKSLLFGKVSRMTGMRSLGPTWGEFMGLESWWGEKYVI